MARFDRTTFEFLKYTPEQRTYSADFSKTGVLLAGESIVGADLVVLDHLGNPPEESRGLHYAIQTLLFENELIFFRVASEGFSKEDYLMGFQFLQQTSLIPKLSALFLPGVGDKQIIDAVEPVCTLHDSLLLMNESDLYDYITS